MSTSMIKRLAALFAVSALALATVACGGSDNSKATDEGTTATQSMDTNTTDGATTDTQAAAPAAAPADATAPKADATTETPSTDGSEAN